MSRAHSTGISRRNLLSAAPLTAAAGTATAAPSRKRPRIAAVVSEYRRYSHAQHILDRFLWGYGWGNRHHRPDMDLVSVYVDQTSKNTLIHDRLRRFPSMKKYPTIAEALTQGGSRLAVDGVLLIGEHGKYPRNEKGQTLYPRYEWFKEITRVFRDSGRSVPVFNDKHLSWKWEWAKEMVDISRELDFAFLAGSSVPVTPRLPSIDMPLGVEIEEALCLAVGGMDGYDIHALEGLQCMVERRRGGETGAASIHGLKGDPVYQAMKAGSWQAGGWDPELFQACLCRSHSLTPSREGFNHVLPSLEEVPRLIPEHTPVAYRFEYLDGLKGTILLMEGLVMDFTFAARLKGGEVISTQMFLPPREVCNFFNPQCNHVEQMFLTGKAGYPVERTLLTTGLTAAGVESVWQGQKRLETPHLNIRYQPTQESTFWRS